MQVQITGKNMDIGEALTTHIQDNLTQVSEKYFENPIESQVTLSKGPHAQIAADITVHVKSNIYVNAHEEAGDAYAAFEQSLAKIQKQLRKYKDRLKDHSQRMAEVEVMQASQYVIEAEEEEAEQEASLEDNPVIVAEMSTHLPELSVSEAVMRLDLTNEPVFIFRNRTHGDLNVVYRRKDGNISWIDPTGNQAPPVRKAAAE